MSYKLTPQIKNISEVKGIFREHSISFKLGSGESVQTLLIYLPYNNGKTDVTSVFEIVKSSLMANFVFRHSEIEKKLGFKSNDSSEDLFKKAVRKLSQHTAQGELGELILFTLLDVYFKAPKILSKISMKTSRRMPVFGADAVHAQFKDGSLRLYIGESKLHGSFNTAVSKATKSIAKSTTSYTDEWDLIESYLDFPEMDEELTDLLLSTLDPFSTNNNIDDILHTPCFIGFEEHSVFGDSEEEYLNNYTTLAEKHVDGFYSKIKTEGVDVDKTALLLLPFSSIADLVSGFIDYMEIGE